MFYEQRDRSLQDKCGFLARQARSLLGEMRFPDGVCAPPGGAAQWLRGETRFPRSPPMGLDLRTGTHDTHVSRYERRRSEFEHKRRELGTERKLRER